MIDTDKPMFSDAIANFSLIYNRGFAGPELKRAYWNALKHLSRDEFMRATTHLMSTWKWPRIPAPADFIQAAKTVGWL
jgi:hypothetical protein